MIFTKYYLATPDIHTVDSANAVQNPLHAGDTLLKTIRAKIGDYFFRAAKEIQWENGWGGLGGYERIFF